MAQFSLYLQKSDLKPHSFICLFIHPLIQIHRMHTAWHVKCTQFYRRVSFRHCYISYIHVIFKDDKHVWDMPNHIEFALVLSHFSFSMLECYFSLSFHTINLQFEHNVFSDSQAVCYIFFYTQLFFRIFFSGFSG